jgi:hypothetical protein
MPAQATGNRRLRILVDMQIQNYASAHFKRDKTVIVTTVLHAVKAACPVGAFVRFDGERWWEVPDSTSREKIACMLRDSLSDIYRSSNKNKVERRRAKKALQRSNHETQLENKVAATEKKHSFAAPLNMTLEQIQPIVFDGFDLLNMYESVDETIFDDVKPAKTVAEAAAQMVSDEEASPISPKTTLRLGSRFIR